MQQRITCVVEPKLGTKLLTLDLLKAEETETAQFRWALC